jgi:hypothetical protein
MATAAPISACIAFARDAGIELCALVRQGWPTRGGRRIDEALQAHVMTLLESVTALPPEQQTQALGGIISTLLYSLVSSQEQLMSRSPLGRRGF